jgi:hypothetical protein
MLFRRKFITLGLATTGDQPMLSRRKFITLGLATTLLPQLQASTPEYTSYYEKIKNHIKKKTKELDLYWDRNDIEALSYDVCKIGNANEDTLNLVDEYPDLL